MTSNNGKESGGDTGGSSGNQPAGAAAQIPLQMEMIQAEFKQSHSKPATTGKTIGPPPSMEFIQNQANDQKK